MVIKKTVMLHTLLVFLLLAFMLAVTSTCSVRSNHYSRPEDWNLVWSDEFDSGLIPEIGRAHV